jgi:hypothetical protein
MDKWLVVRIVSHRKDESGIRYLRILLVRIWARERFVGTATAGASQESGEGFVPLEWAALADDRSWSRLHCALCSRGRQKSLHDRVQ